MQTEQHKTGEGNKISVYVYQAYLSRVTALWCNDPDIRLKTEKLNVPHNEILPALLYLLSDSVRNYVIVICRNSHLRFVMFTCQQQSIR